MRTFWFGIGRRWRGVAVEKTLFGPVLRFGWLSLGASQYDPPDFIKTWHAALREALAKAKPSTTKGQQS